MKIFLVIITITLGLSTSSYADDSLATAEEAAAVIRSLETPDNLSAAMLKSALETAKASNLKIDLKTLKVQKLNEYSYQVEFSLNYEGSAESASVRISEVMIRNSKAYVFSFDIERALQKKKYPGVSMGNN